MTIGSAGHKYAAASSPYFEKYIRRHFNTIYCRPMSSGEIFRSFYFSTELKSSYNCDTLWSLCCVQLLTAVVAIVFEAAALVVVVVPSLIFFGNLCTILGSKTSGRKEGDLSFCSSYFEASNYSIIFGRQNVASYSLLAFLLQAATCGCYFQLSQLRMRRTKSG